MNRFIRDSHGFYTVEAALILPLVILAMLSIGYFIRVDSLWESCMFDAIDESALTQARSIEPVFRANGAAKVKERIEKDNTGLSDFTIESYIPFYADMYSSGITSCSFSAETELKLPLGFSRSFNFNGRLKYRGFTGSKYGDGGMGAQALETDEISDPVYIFPQDGIRYHTENCTYVKSNVFNCILSNSTKSNYSPCGICGSGELSIGSVVFCFKSKDTSYHKGSCRCIKHHTAKVNKGEAVKLGYTPCSKCGSL